MSMDRWDPFRDMVAARELMDRWLQQSLSGTGQLLSTIRPESIPVDVIEHDDSYEVRAALAGVKPEDIEVTVHGERIVIRAELRAADEQRGDTWLLREHRSGTLQRSITLPGAVSSDKTEARVDNGVLSLTLPKLQSVQPRRIAVGSGQARSASPGAGGASTASGTEIAVGGAETKHQSHGSRDDTAQGDKVTEESQESFPASDPPSWTPEKM